MSRAKRVKLDGQTGPQKKFTEPNRNKLAHKRGITEQLSSEEDQSSGSDEVEATLDENVSQSSSNGSSAEDSGAEESDVSSAFDGDSGEVSEDGVSEDDGFEEKTGPAQQSDFGTALGAILGSKIKAHDRSNPILIRNKKSARDIEEARIEAKARRLLRAEKLEKQDRARVKYPLSRDPDVVGAALQREKVLRKTAQRGVVRLFNAIHVAQRAENADNDHKDVVGVDKRSHIATDVTKEKFLDMIRSG